MISQEEHPRLIPEAMQKAFKVVDMLYAAGHEAALVGGCVRDYVLGRDINDCDIVTSANHDEIVAVFPQATLVGESFGVSMVKHDGVYYQVATYRQPVEVDKWCEPVADLQTDLRHRDFTINTLLMHPEGEPIDLFRSIKALDDKMIRAVGDPLERFKEDPLRILRAVRFSCQLGFMIDWDTTIAMRQLAPLLADVAPERIGAEMTKILTSGRADTGLRVLLLLELAGSFMPELLSLSETEQNPKHHPEGNVLLHTLGLLERLPAGCSPSLAWAALLHDIGKPPTKGEKDGQPTFYGHEEVGAEMARKIMSRLRLPNELIDKVVSHVAQHMRFRLLPEMRRGKVLQFIRQPNFEELLALHKLDAAAGSGNMANAEFAEKLLAETPPDSLKPVPLITGKDLIELGLEPGPMFRDILGTVEMLQLEGKIADREAALSYVLVRKEFKGLEEADDGV